MKLLPLSITKILKIEKKSKNYKIENDKKKNRKFLLKKVAIPAALTTAVIVGINKLTQTDASEEPTYQMQKESEKNTSLLSKIWFFALPIVQPYIKSFIKEQINNRFGNSGR